jgi:hypothetical protein
LFWVHPGFSIYVGPPVEASEIVSLQSQARYITRPIMAMDALEKLADGNLVLKTLPDPKTGATSIKLDLLEWIHRITPISRTQDAIVKDFTGPIPTAPGFPQRPQMENSPACRQRYFANATIRIAPGKHAVPGLG